MKYIQVFNGEWVKNLNRRAIGIEIEERYCEIAAKRLTTARLAKAA